MSAPADGPVSGAPPPYRCTAEGVRLAIRITPKARANEFGALDHDAAGQAFLRARVTAPPEDGKANRALTKLVARALKLPASRVSVAAGAKDRQKSLLIEGDAGDLTRRIDRWLGALK